MTGRMGIDVYVWKCLRTVFVSFKTRIHIVPKSLQKGKCFVDMCLQIEYIYRNQRISSDLVKSIILTLQSPLKWAQVQGLERRARDSRSDRSPGGKSMTSAQLSDCRKINLSWKENRYFYIFWQKTNFGIVLTNNFLMFFFQHILIRFISPLSNMPVIKVLKWHDLINI